jgi:hypothetical protein
MPVRAGGGGPGTRSETAGAAATPDRKENKP